MIRWIHLSTAFAALALLVFLALPGCTTGKKEHAAKGKEHDKDKHAEEHGGTGPHGGPLAEWEELHAEVTVDHPAKLVVVYILDDKAKKAPELEAAKFTKVKLKILGEKPEIVIDLKHDEKKSGKEGIAFTGPHDFFGKERAFEGTVSATVDGKPKESELFKYEPKKDSGEKKKTVSRGDLFRTPGGIYTAADIKANGDLPAKEKFKKVIHRDDEAKPGDKICPISKGKANPDCFWVVNGQRYEFCCPPCVDSFLKLAHEEPAQVKDAAAYVKAP
jgi:hypothetical protein